jgi:hypothetical protein
MIKLSMPKAYGHIKPLYGSSGQPIRCTDPGLVDRDPSRDVDEAAMPQPVRRANTTDARR